MSWQNAFIHLGNFLLLPLFVGCFVGVCARTIYFKQCSYRALMTAGFCGCLTGLVLGWVITGRDGHMLGYALCVFTCCVFILITAGRAPKTKKQKNKPYK
ncbi:MAG: hypothetical protein ACRCWR_05180 [Saezia sp.]